MGCFSSKPCTLEVTEHSRKNQPMTSRLTKDRTTPSLQRVSSNLSEINNQIGWEDLLDKCRLKCVKSRWDEKTLQRCLDSARSHLNAIVNWILPRPTVVGWIESSTQSQRNFEKASNHYTQLPTDHPMKHYIHITKSLESFKAALLALTPRNQKVLIVTQAAPR
jgi:hypothetical protein